MMAMVINDYDSYMTMNDAHFGEYPRVFFHCFEVFILDRPIAAPWHLWNHKWWLQMFQRSWKYLIWQKSTWQLATFTAMIWLTWYSRTLLEWLPLSLSENYIVVKWTNSACLYHHSSSSLSLKRTCCLANSGKSARSDTPGPRAEPPKLKRVTMIDLQVKLMMIGPSQRRVMMI